MPQRLKWSVLRGMTPIRQQREGIHSPTISDRVADLMTDLPVHQHRGTAGTVTWPDATSADWLDLATRIRG